MSAIQVRTAFRDVVAPLLTPLGFTYVESINLASATADLPANWYTLDFIAADDARLALGRPTLFRESGSAVVMIFTEQQVQDADATGAADAVRTALANWWALGGQLRVIDVQPPADIDGGDFRGAFYGVSVESRYAYDHFID